MSAYLLRRLLLIIPTLWAIITLNFFIVQIALAARSIRPLPPLSSVTPAACPAPAEAARAAVMHARAWVISPTASIAAGVALTRK